MMEYRVIKSKIDESFDVITEDGGASFHYHNGKRWVSNYYQGRLTESAGFVGIWWEELHNSNTYVKDWEEGMNDLQTIIKAALNWLVMPSPEEWTVNDKLFDNLFNKNKF